jgi:hypothetical protein
MSDAIVPNKTIYWSYMEEDWSNYIKLVKGETIRVFSRAIWHCDQCNRLYNWEPTDSKLYTYVVEGNSTEAVDCSCKNELTSNDLIPIYSMNDFEMIEIEDTIRKDKEPIFPRKVLYCPKCKRVYVQKDNNIKVFSVENIIELET